MAKILVIDDNATNRDLLDRYLGRRGYEVIGAADGAIGLRQAWTQHPDLILLDLTMPVFDGWDTAAQLKGTAETRHIPIIAVTAMSREETQARPLGCDDYAGKPLDLPGLLAKIEFWLRRTAAHPAPAWGA